MKMLFSCLVLLTVFVQAKPKNDFEILQSEVLTITDSTKTKKLHALQFKAHINTETVSRFALLNRKSQDVLYVFNVVQQEDGFYCEGNESYRKIYNGIVSHRLSLQQNFKEKDLELVYYIGGQPQKLRL